MNFLENFGKSLFLMKEAIDKSLQKFCYISRISKVRQKYEIRYKAQAERMIQLVNNLART